MKKIITAILCFILMLDLTSCITIVKKDKTIPLDLKDAKKVDETVNEDDMDTDNQTEEKKDDKKEEASQSDEKDETPSAEVKNGKLAGLKICVDPGHGDFTESIKEPIAPGSSQMKAAFVSGTSGSYQTEAEFNLKVGLLLKEMLEAEGAIVYMTRTGSKAELSNVGRAELANDNGCDLAVRIHADGSENTSVSGISMLVPGAGLYITDTLLISESTAIGQAVLNAVLEKTGAENRGIIPRTDLTGFNWSTVPSILIECGFMSNPSDDAKLADPEYQKKIAEGILEGLIEYYN
ncbi:MAG: N-acetylmuramoyl-L-alanine amidase [Ruminococcaceae bacterium]|nr:N-acetylmuramoyl-L-alanine amidase [Oscillospiraceae bacterium]